MKDWSKWVELGWKGSALLLLIGNLYLTSNYTTKDELKAELKPINDNLYAITISQAKMENVPVVLLDHESRMRSIERLVYSNSKTTGYRFLLQEPEYAGTNQDNLNKN